MTGLVAQRAASGAVLALCVALGALHRSSSASSWSRPSIADLRLRGASDGVEARYLLAYSWNERALNAVRLPGKVPPLPALGDAQVVELRAELPAKFGSADSPEAFKAWIDSWPRDAAFLARLPRVLSRAARATEPRMGRYAAAAFALEAYRLKADDVRLYWLPAPPEDARLLSSLLAPGAPSGTAPLDSRRPPVTVHVLNASGAGGVALQVTKVLRLRQADVVDFGNAPSISERTQIIDRTGDFHAARLVRDALGCRQAYVMSRVEPAPKAAVTALIGKDYASCLALPGGAQPD